MLLLYINHIRLLFHNNDSSYVTVRTVIIVNYWESQQKQLFYNCITAMLLLYMNHSKVLCYTSQSNCLVIVSQQRYCCIQITALLYI